MLSNLHTQNAKSPAMARATSADISKSPIDLLSTPPELANQNSLSARSPSRSFEEKLKQNIQAIEKNSERKLEKSAGKKSTPVLPLPDDQARQVRLEKIPQPPRIERGLKSDLPAAGKVESSPPDTAAIARVSVNAKSKTSDPGRVGKAIPGPTPGTAVALKTPVREEAVPQPVQDFLTAMKKELGITPDQLVTAMQSLSPQQLEQPPEQTLPLVLERLNLKDSQIPRAQQLVGKLMEDLKGRGLDADFQGLSDQQKLKFQALMEMDHATRGLFLDNQQLPYSSEGGPGIKAILDNVIQVAQRLDSKFKDLDQADDFEAEPADDGTAGSPEGLAAASGLATSPLPQAEFSKSSGREAEPTSTRLIPARPSLHVVKSDFDPARAHSPDLSFRPLGNERNFDPQLVKRQGLEDVEGIKSTGDDVWADSESLGVQSMAFKPINEKISNRQMGSSLPDSKSVLSTAEALQGLNLSKNMAHGESSAQGRQFSGGGKNSRSAGLQSLNLGKVETKLNESALANGKPTFATNLSANKAEVELAPGAALTQNQELKNENVQQLTQQAQHAFKKGGGEMVMKLTPEGMGQVHLKVAIADGKVHVQMLADNADAKKMLESQLGDLRKSLEGQNIRVDHMRIDVADHSQLGSSTDTNRGFSQHFQGQFQDRSRDPRQNLNTIFDPESPRRYVTAANGAPTARAPMRSTTSRLNLVA